MKFRTILSALTIIIVILIDQSIKFVVKTNMYLYEKITITPWFQIFFTENQGMAFGMDFINTIVLASLRFCAIIGLLIYLRRLIRLMAPIGFIFCFSFMIAGAIGNIIDNAFYGLCYTESIPFSQVAHLAPLGKGYEHFMNGRVVDMFYFPLFTWPNWMPIIAGKTFFGAVFNFADAAISCGAFYILFGYYHYINNLLFKKSHDKENQIPSPSSTTQL